VITESNQFTELTRLTSSVFSAAQKIKSSHLLEQSCPTHSTHVVNGYLNVANGFA